MNLIKHFVITLIFSSAFFIISDYEFVLIAVLISLITTITLDFIDHSIAIFTYKAPINKDIRALVFSGKFIEAYKTYFRRRKKEQSRLILHDWPFVIASVVITVLSINSGNNFLLAIFGFGTLLHYICDLYEDLILKQNVKYWLAGK